MYVVFVCRHGSPAPRAMRQQQQQQQHHLGGAGSNRSSRDLSMYVMLMTVMVLVDLFTLYADVVMMMAM